ncbi:MAG: glycosyltransferase family 4 protein [Acidimicrobiales bacterium]
MVTHYWPPHVGGIEAVAVEEARHLSQRGWEVSVATSRGRGDRSVERPGPILVERFRCINLLERRFNVPVPLMDPKMFLGIWRRARQADVVIAHGHVFIGTIYAAAVARLTKKPLILVQHSPYVEYGPILATAERLADRTIGRWVIRSARRVIAVSEPTSQFVRSLVPEAAVATVHSGVDQRRFFPARHPAHARPMILTVRRLVPRNGIDLLIEAWHREDLGKVAELCIGGSGADMDRLAQMAGDDPSIRLLGHVPEHELAELYRNADLFVLPSRSGEGFGLVVLEAMACGLPVLATRCGGVTDVVEDGTNGRLVPRADVVSLATMLRALIDSPQIRRELRKGALKTASYMSWDRSIDRLEKQLLEVLAARAPLPRRLQPRHDSNVTSTDHQCDERAVRCHDGKSLLATEAPARVGSEQANQRQR